MMRQPLPIKIAYLFLFIYIVIYCLSTQFFPTFIVKPIWSVLVPWFAKLLGETADATPFPTGSGDTYFNYYQLLLFFLISLLTAVILGIVDRKRTSYLHLHKWLILLLRYYIGFQMINYGLAKIFYLQFGEISIQSLRQPFGDMTPMGLLWRFMGFSKAYCMFTGFAEFIGGILLLSRRTTLLGALITFGVMVNVMMMNYCYDVPVKLLSTHLVVFSLIIISFWGRNLIDFFFEGRGFEPRQLDDIVALKHQKVKNYIKWILIFLFMAYSFYQLYSYTSIIEERNTPKVAFYGIYDVEKFEKFRDGERMENPVPESIWKELFIQPNGESNIDFLTGYPSKRTVKIDTAEHIIVFITNPQDSSGTNYSYEFREGGKLILNGNIKEDSLSIELQERKPFRLTSTGFNWVNQYPNSR